MATEADDTNMTEKPTRVEKKQAKFVVSNVAALVIAGFIVVTSTFLFIKGKPTKTSVCNYDLVYRKASCIAKQLSEIPHDIPDSALTIHMGHKHDKAENSFASLQRQNFSRFQTLQDLRLVKCGIRTIEGDTFSDLSALRILDLRYNKIGSVDESTFKGLTSLEYLYLSNNPITHLSDFTFRGIRIENLVLANNPALTTLSEKTFAGAILKTLVLNRCGLSKLSNDLFSHVAGSLQELHITNNLQPLSLAQDTFKGLHFSVLNLDNNGLQDETFLQETLADELSLDGNPLGELSLENCASMKNTRRLSLSNTGQQMLSADDFRNFINLEELDLEENNLVNFNASDLTRLEHLKIIDVSNNRISQVTGDFSNLPSLLSLYLDGNELYTLGDTLASVMDRLDNITIHNNPLHCNCEVKWLVSWLADNKESVDDLEAITCATPNPTNLTHMSETDFVCTAPKILNATMDSDGTSLVCTAEGDPAPVVVWAASDDPAYNKTVAPQEPYRKDVQQTTVVMPVARDTNFTCTATNHVGSDSITLDTSTETGHTHRGPHGKGQGEIEILETPVGFWITVFLVILFGYLMRISRDEDDSC